MLLVVVICLAGITRASEDAFRGIPLSRKSFYDSARDFTCLDGSETIPFSLVNDDYCDCADGSDEPGTSACPNGIFFCVNKGHKPFDLLSSRVNDGICDCCDGSDEYDSSVKCTNMCDEQGRKARAERQIKLERQEAGYKKKLEYISDGKNKEAEMHDKLAKLKSEIGLLNTELDILEEAKIAAEEPEKIAKEAQDKKWAEEHQAVESAEREAKARKGFKELDIDENSLISIEELQLRNELDDDGNEDVSKEEAIEYLGGEEPLDFDTFYAMSWDKVSGAITFKYEEEGDEGIKDEGDINDDEEEEDDDDDDDDDMVSRKVSDKVIYDEATQALIDAADKAREDWDEAKGKKRNLEKEIGDIEKFLGMDFGKDNEFIPFYEQCYEYTDREYTYKLCTFQKSTQRNKNGGSETSLGTWGKWDGPENDRYSRMKYENGEKCWNGPSRSTTVKLKCGAEDKVTAAMEPNRCEYLLEFVTPAVCQPVDHSLYHEEL